MSGQEEVGPFQVEVVWNREFEFCRCGEPFLALHNAVLFARNMVASGDGARVKKARVVDPDGNVVWDRDKSAEEG